MDILEAIYRRRTIRRYTNQSVPVTVLNTLIDAAVQAPSALNQQPWAFAVFRGRERLRKFSEHAKAYFFNTMEPSFGLDPRADLFVDPKVNIFYDAETLLVIFAKPGGFNPAEDCCLAAQNVMLTAHALGLGTATVGIARPWLNQYETKTALSIPLAYTAVFPLTVGFPAESPPSRPRLPPEIVSWHEEPVGSPAEATR